MHKEIQATSLRPTVTLTDHQLAQVRDALHEQRRFRIEQVDELTADANTSTASDDPKTQVDAVLRLAAETALEEITAALQRLDDRSFGRCQTCSTAIPWERLEVLPSSRLCTGCQQRTEWSGSRHPRRGLGPRPSPAAASR